MVFDLSFAGYSLTGREDVASLANFLGRIVLTEKPRQHTRGQY